MNPPAKPTLSRERALHTYTLSMWIELAGVVLIALLWFATIRMVQQDYEDELQAAFRTQATLARAMDLQPKQITAVMLGLNSKIATFALQRQINEYSGEPLQAILPGVALQELWSLMGTAEKALFVVSLFVVLTGLIGMLTAILTSLKERRREVITMLTVCATPIPCAC